MIYIFSRLPCLQLHFPSPLSLVHSLLNLQASRRLPFSVRRSLLWDSVCRSHLWDSLRSSSLGLIPSLSSLRFTPFQTPTQIDFEVENPRDSKAPNQLKEHCSVVVVVNVMEVVVDLVNIIWDFGISCLENIDPCAACCFQRFFTGHVCI